MFTTLAEAKASTLKSIAGVATSSTRFNDYVNEATRLLLRRGDWVGTVVPIQLTASQGFVTFPRYVGEVRKLNFHRQTVAIWNGWYAFLDYQRDLHDYQCGSCWWPGTRPEISQSTDRPCQQEIAGAGRTVRAVTTVAGDAGKFITLFGVDANDLPLVNPSTHVPGLTLTLTGTYVQTATEVKRIDRVLKDATVGNVSLYAHVTATDALETLSVYEPSETNPSYRRFYFRVNLCAAGGTVNVIALVKLRYVPVAVDTDLILIQNIDALKFAIQSIQNREAGDWKQSRESMAAAVNELNQEKRDQMPDDQIPVTVRSGAGGEDININ